MSPAETPVHNVVQDLLHLLEPIDSLTHDPDNPIEHGDLSTESLKQSLQEFGQDSPVVAGHDRVVYIGNGRLEAARQLGWTHVAVVFRDEDPVTLRARALADNRTRTLSSWHKSNLAENLRMVQAADPSLIVGWTAEGAAAIATPPPDPVPKVAPPEFPSFDEQIHTEHECPACKFVWSGKS